MEGQIVKWMDEKTDEEMNERTIDATKWLYFNNKKQTENEFEKKIKMVVNRMNVNKTDDWKNVNRTDNWKNVNRTDNWKNVNRTDNWKNVNKTENWKNV